MKSHAVFIALLCLVINSRAEIRNGYEPDMESARTSLRSLRKLMDEDSNLSVFQRLQISTRIHRLTEFITYHDLTTKLLEHFRIISPATTTIFACRWRTPPGLPRLPNFTPTAARAIF